MQALDKKITFGMFVKNLGDKLKGVMAKSISPEEKLELITAEMEKDVQEKRVTARGIRVKMLALKDPDTKELEPIERFKVRREKLVKMGAEALKVKGDEKEAAKIAKEIKSLDISLNSMENTYAILEESYGVALESYKTAEAALDHVKHNGSAILFSIKAHKDALETKDSARGEKIDASFLDDLQKELETSQRELRSDKEMDGSEDSVLDDSEEADQSIMDEFRK